MGDEKKDLKDSRGATYGSGTQIVEGPDKPTQLEKEHPKDELPKKVGDPNDPQGRVLDLDTGDVTRPETVEISGVRIDVSEFGEKGVGFLHEMYEQFLFAVQEEQVSKFHKIGPYGADETKILDEMRAYNLRLLPMVKARRDTSNKQRKLYQYVTWDQDRTFEDWIAWTICTLRWRINHELTNRANKGVITHIDSVVAKETLGECLVTCEKFMALSEQRRLTAI